MNIRKIVTYNNLRKQFTAEETVLADVLYNASETDRELIIESLQPGKSATKRASRKTGKKSQRASGMAAAIKGNIEAGRQAVKEDDNEDKRCTVIRDGRACGLLPDHNVHHMKTHPNYHEFDAGKSDNDVLPAPRRSSANVGAGSGIQNSGTETEDVSNVHHVASGD